MRQFKHWSLGYIYDRFRQFAYQRTNQSVPWIAAGMVDILDQLLMPTDRGIEWGTGRSTIWFARRVRHLVAIEENDAWYNQVAAHLAEERLSEKVDLRLVPAAREVDAANYADNFRDIAPSSLDFAIVDGAMRDHCAAAGITLLKPGGFLIIDNVERYIPRATPSRAPNSRALIDGYPSLLWNDIGATLSKWRMIWVTDGISDTALWLKPLDFDPEMSPCER